MHHWHADVIACTIKPALVLVHSFTEDGLVWIALAEVLDELHGKPATRCPNAKGGGLQSPTTAPVSLAEVSALAQ